MASCGVHLFDRDPWRDRLQRFRYSTFGADFISPYVKGRLVTSQQALEGRVERTILIYYTSSDRVRSGHRSAGNLHRAVISRYHNRTGI